MKVKKSELLAAAKEVIVESTKGVWPGTEYFSLKFDHINHIYSAGFRAGFLHGRNYVDQHPIEEKSSITLWLESGVDLEIADE